MSADLWSTLGVGVVLFASTNIDDLLLLATWFAACQVSAGQVVLGQLLGIATLVGVSALAASAALVIPPAWIALTGLAPLWLGLCALARLLRGDRAEGEDDVAAAPARRVLAVAAVTIANGGDNLAVYIPVFAADPPAILVHAALFLAMTGLWCALGYSLVRNPLAGARASRIGHAVLPFVLIGLGVAILRDARALLGR